MTGITDTSYQLVDLDPGYVYSYKVKAVTAEGEESDYSNVVKVDLSTGICDCRSRTIECIPITVILWSSVKRHSRSRSLI